MTKYLYTSSGLTFVHEISIQINASKDVQERLYHALRVESSRDIPRTEVEMGLGESFKLRIIAEDLHALRAAINSYMRWIALAMDIEEVIDNGS